LNSIQKYLSLVKFSHTVFALPFALIGFTLGLVNCAHLKIDFYLLAKVLACMVFARNSAMAFNRYIDRDIDKLNSRTAIREIPSGLIKANSALIFVIVNSLLFVFTTYLINKLCFYLSPVALLVILGYSLTKRFTALCHLVLGLGLSLAPVGAYLAVCGKFNIIPVLYSGAVLFWVSGFDIIYALQDEEFDSKMKLNSIPVKLGKKNSLRLSQLLHIISFLCLLSAGFIFGNGLFFTIGLLIFSVLLTYQHLIVKPNDLSKINLAFFTTNGIASVIFGTLVIIDLFFS
jgi:4-hydroxybenzoate polyprenyltransferase